MKELKRYPSSLQALFYLSLFCLIIHSLFIGYEKIFNDVDVNFNYTFLIFFVFSIVAMAFYDVDKELKDIKARLDKFDPPGDDVHD